MTIVLFIAVLFFLVLVHELGHFLTAKWSKMRVDEFAIGFPPRLLSFKKGETEYSINLLPIGGYVKILGENGIDEITETDRTKSFGARPYWQQAVVLIAGVTMNILVAWLIFFAVAMIGTPTFVSHPTTNSHLTVVSILPDSPASEVDIPLGAIITSITPINTTGVNTDEIAPLTPASLSEIITTNPDSEFELSYTLNSQFHTIAVSPKTGVIEENPEQAAIGLSTALVEVIKENPITAIGTATYRTIDAIYAITTGLITFFASAFTLSADLTQVAGPIGIAGMVGEAAQLGLVSLLTFTAFISLNLAVINLLPIPALDGGRLVFVLIEAIIRRPLDPKWTNIINLAGFILLISLMIAVTYGDIVKLF